MRRVFGPRTLVEAAFIVAVPLGASALGYDTWRIIGAAAVAYLIVALVEVAVARPRGQRVTPTPVTPHEQAPPALPEPVLEAEPEPEPEPVLQPVPDPEPEPEPEPEPAEPEPEPAAATVVPIGVSAAPRRWNLWDLERLTRAASGGDATVDEERGFLLMYMREFAGADGELPIDFDALVRDSFGDLVGAR